MREMTFLGQKTCELKLPGGFREYCFYASDITFQKSPKVILCPRKSLVLISQSLGKKFKNRFSRFWQKMDFFQHFPLSIKMVWNYQLSKIRNRVQLRCVLRWWYDTNVWSTSGQRLVHINSIRQYLVNKFYSFFQLI